jgi:hypothetical protein
MVRACGTHGKGEKCVSKSFIGKPEGRDHLEEIGVGGRIILKFI